MYILNQSFPKIVVVYIDVSQDNGGATDLRRRAGNLAELLQFRNVPEMQRSLGGGLGKLSGDFGKSVKVPKFPEKFLQTFPSSERFP